MTITQSSETLVYSYFVCGTEIMYHPVTLLDEYQYDDDQTTDLLAAIRQWNLTPRLSDSVTVEEGNSNEQKTGVSHSSSYPYPVLESSLSNSYSMTDNDTLTSSTVSSAKKAPRTPSFKSNFSSRPSGITSRLLMFDPPKEKEGCSQVSSEMKPLASYETFQDDSREIQQRSKQEQIVNEKQNTTSNDIMNLPEDRKNDEHHQILMDTAKQLGLEEDQLHLILPTIKKLVQVVTQHVPHLESFVEKVTDTVLNSESSTCALNITPKRKSNIKKRNMSTRREEMNQVLTILAEQQTRNGVDKDTRMPNQQSKMVQYDFKERVKQQLFPNLIRSRSVETPIKTNAARTSITSEAMEHQYTNDEILAEITRLVEFEERYKKVHGVDIPEDIPGNDTTLQDLLNTDRTTLRRFVLHFAYLFSVRQDEVLEKMNELYIFSHEATSLIRDLKKAFDMPMNCPIHSVARRILTEVKHQKSI